MAAKPETSGTTIAACGTAVTSARLAEGLHAAGLKARAFALVSLQARPDWHAGLDVGSFDWLVLVSPTAAQLTIDALGGIFTGRIACTGEATAAVVKRAGFSVAVVPADQNRKGLLDAMSRQSSRGTVLLPISDAAPQELADGLSRLKFKVTVPVTYINRPDAQAVEDFSRALAGGDVQAVAFTSASAVEYAAAGGLENVRVYCIGPSTAEAVWARKLKVAAVAEHHSVGGLVKSVVKGEKRG